MRLTEIDKATTHQLWRSIL